MEGIKEPKPKRRKTKGAVGRLWNAESCQKMIGAVNRRETKESQRREISGTEAKRQQNRDQRGPTPKRGSKGITKGAASARTKGIGGGSSVESQIKGAIWTKIR